MAKDKFCSVEASASDKFCAAVAADGDKFCSVTAGIASGSITGTDLLFFTAPDNQTSAITTTGTWNAYVLSDPLGFISSLNDNGGGINDDLTVYITDPGQYAEATVRVRLDSDSGIYDDITVTYDDGS